MKRLLPALLLLSLCAAVAAAEEQAGPNTLTPKEAADGWLLLFDGATTFGWQAPNRSTWHVVEAMLYPQADTPGLLVSNAGFSDYELKLDYRVRSDARAELRTGCGPGGDVRPGNYSVMLPRVAGGWCEGRLTVRGGLITGHSFTSKGFGEGVGGKAATGPPQAATGDRIALAGNGVIFRSIKLKPTGLKPLFNGKDLTGWKEVKTARTRSKFTVTGKGELNVEDGPGDLQTEGQFDDFLLQLECRSNGDHLNSGVFFRCLAGQFWRGYEAQVRNQWKDGDRTKPVDYGTGGIYNRQPARKVVSSDREWFTMTVVAQGNHLAIWVNGDQTADFTDRRPADRDARKGTKTDKGPVSLQGHDPTTDLSFRNIRIAELPRAKQ
jgi:hypothetical protein